MILPSKHLHQDRSLLTVGMRLLKGLNQPMTVSALWENTAHQPGAGREARPLRYDSFVLGLDLLFLINAIELDNGVLIRRSP